MRSRTRRLRAGACSMVLAPILLSGAAAEVASAAEVRFLHAVPGGPGARLSVEGGPSSGPVGFGEASDYLDTGSGATTAAIVAGGEPLGAPTDIEADGRYTLLARPADDGEGATVTLLRDGEAEPGQTRWRMVHAAPEIDEAELLLEGRVVDRLSVGEAGGYRSEEPGQASISVRRPGEEEPLAEDPDVQLVAGTSQTAYLIGTAGEPTRFVVLQDSVEVPVEAPDTGLGGLAASDDPPWLYALLAALLAGAAGGGVARMRRARP